MKKTKKFQKVNRPKKEKGLSLGRVIANNFYVLRIIQEVAPFYLVTYFLWSVAGALINFLTGTYLLRYVINTFQVGGEMKQIFLFIGICALANLGFNFWIDCMRRFLYPRYNQRIVARVEKMLFDKAAKVELACYEDPAFYDKYVRSMENSYEKCMNTVYTVDGLIWSAVSMSANAIMIVTIDPVLLIFALLPLLLGFVQKKRNTVLHEFDQKRDPIDRKINYVQRTFYLGEYAKEMRLSEMHKNMFAKQKEAWLDYKKLIADYGFVKGFTIFLTNFGKDGVIVLGAMLYSVFQTTVTGNMLIGDCIVVLNSIESLSWQLTDLVTRITDLHKNAVYIEDLRHFMDYEPKIRSTEKKTPQRGEIALRKVSFTYAGAHQPSLSGIDLTVRPGEKIALVGHNGSGKSTLVKLLLRLYDPTEGEILQSGTPIAMLDPEAYRGQFGVVFQDFKLFSLSVAENVLLRPYCDEDEETVIDALQKSGAWAVVEKLPHGIHTTLTREFDDEGVNLSGGEAQKVALARIFASPSEVVIVDEPSSALDPIAEYTLFENLLSACTGKTMIFISHRLSSAVLADRVVYLDGGRITEMGSHRELMERGGSYADLFSKQSENYRQEFVGKEASDGNEH